MVFSPGQPNEANSYVKECSKNTIRFIHNIIIYHEGADRSAVDRFLGMEEGRGSNPLRSIGYDTGFTGFVL